MKEGKELKGSTFKNLAIDTLPREQVLENLQAIEYLITNEANVELVVTHHAVQSKLLKRLVHLDKNHMDEFTLKMQNTFHNQPFNSAGSEAKQY